MCIRDSHEEPPAAGDEAPEEDDMWMKDTYSVLLLVYSHRTDIFRNDGENIYPEKTERGTRVWEYVWNAGVCLEL